MVPITPIAWRRRTKAQSSIALEALRVACVTDARVQALEAWAWGNRSKAPSKLKEWTEERIESINADIDSVLAEAKAGA